MQFSALEALNKYYRNEPNSVLFQKYKYVNSPEQKAIYIFQQERVSDPFEEPYSK